MIWTSEKGERERGGQRPAGDRQVGRRNQKQRGWFFRPQVEPLAVFPAPSLGSQSDFTKAPLTLQLRRGPSSLGPAPGWCRSAPHAGAAAGPTLSAAARPSVGATRSPPAPRGRPGSPSQTQTQHHRSPTPAGGRELG
ncbi:unnamed protein product [Gulo gulo]|uniref:Uncharacterized protein n=1 Tax=Gulo gulo TaxID=48420 RepID=A0A9X9M0P4_GULGU|nr:unnamed protein product [Gulo gulo]